MKCSQKHIVFGMVNDKDITSVAKMLPKDAKYYFTQADSHRALKADDVAQVCRALGLEGKCYSSVSQAYISAVKAASDHGFVYVGGSSYIVADFLANCF